MKTRKVKRVKHPVRKKQGGPGIDRENAAVKVMRRGKQKNI